MPSTTDILLALDASRAALETIPGRSYSAGILKELIAEYEQQQRLELDQFWKAFA